MLFSGSDGKDALPGIKERFWDTGLLAKMQSGEMPASPAFIKSITEVELVTAEAQWAADTFFDISSGRSGGGFGVMPLSWLDVHAYCRMRKVKLSHWYIDLIKVMDSIFCKHANKEKVK